MNETMGTVSSVLLFHNEGLQVTDHRMKVLISSDAMSAAAPKGAPPAASMSRFTKTDRAPPYRTGALKRRILSLHFYSFHRSGANPYHARFTRAEN
jgi:hypothetical protein